MVNRYLRDFNQWLIQTPERALEQAYDAALMIKAIEDQHFNGSKIAASSTIQSANVLAGFQAKLKTYLRIIDVRLKEFRASQAIVDSTNATLYNRSPYSVRDRDQVSATLEKLTFIDQVLVRYQPSASNSTAIVPVSPDTASSSPTLLNSGGFSSSFGEEQLSSDKNSILDKTGILPRSILNPLNRIKRDLDPDSEVEMVKTFRATKVKTRVSIRLILLLIIVPLLTQQISKTFIIGPVVDRVWKPDENGIFLNFELEEEALKEFNTFRERLEFDRLLGIAPEIANPEVEQQSALKEKAEEIATQYAKSSTGAIKNVFADLVSVVAFVVVLLSNRRELEVLKQFMDETVYGLSDSAKAFIIILFTDIFVGFHSPHGWEVLLEGMAKHLGLPPSRDFIFLFIATFPVILDTIFKYWIFRYLNRISPSAVATYKNMNET
jgi:CemA family